MAFCKTGKRREWNGSCVGRGCNWRRWGGGGRGGREGGAWWRASDQEVSPGMPCTTCTASMPGVQLQSTCWPPPPYPTCPLPTPLPPHPSSLLPPTTPSRPLGPLPLPRTLLARKAWTKWWPTTAPFWRRCRGSAARGGEAAARVGAQGWAWVRGGSVLTHGHMSTRHWGRCWTR